MSAASAIPKIISNEIKACAIAIIAMMNERDDTQHADMVALIAKLDEIKTAIENHGIV